MKIHLGVALPLAALIAAGGYLVGVRKERGGRAEIGETREPAPNEGRSAADDTPARRAEPAVARDEGRAVHDPATTPAGAAPAAPGAPLAPQADLDRADREFRAETVDARWSQGATSTIQKVGGTKGIGLDVRAVECRALTCRVEIANRRSDRIESAKLAQLASRLAPVLPHAASERIAGADGHDETILYLSRHPL
jgi:hypothetical protein